MRHCPPCLAECYCCRYVGFDVWEWVFIAWALRRFGEWRRVLAEQMNLGDALVNCRLRWLQFDRLQPADNGHKTTPNHSTCCQPNRFESSSLCGPWGWNPATKLPCWTGPQIVLAFQGVSCDIQSLLFLEPEGGSQNVTLVVVLLVVVISSLKIPKAFLIQRSATKLCVLIRAHIPYRSTASDF